MPPGSSKRQRRREAERSQRVGRTGFRHLQAAAEEGQAALSGLVGFAEVANPSDILPGSDPDHHVTEALKAALGGIRCRSWLGFISGSARLPAALRGARPRVHFDRAIRVGSSLPDVWFIAGQAAADHGDWPTALSDWRESLVPLPDDSWPSRGPPRAASPRRFSGKEHSRMTRPPGSRSRPRSSPAMPTLSADRLSPSTHAAGGRTGTTAGFMAWGIALEELADAPGAIRVWRSAVGTIPG